MNWLTSVYEERMVLDTHCNDLDLKACMKVYCTMLESMNCTAYLPDMLKRLVSELHESVECFVDEYFGKCIEAFSLLLWNNTPLVL